MLVETKLASVPLNVTEVVAILFVSIAVKSIARVDTVELAGFGVDTRLLVAIVGPLKSKDKIVLVALVAIFPAISVTIAKIVAGPLLSVLVAIYEYTNVLVPLTYVAGLLLTVNDVVATLFSSDALNLISAKDVLDANGKLDVKP